MLRHVGPLYRYFPTPSKSCLIAKEHFYENVKETFKKSELRLTTVAERHLATVIRRAIY